MCNWVWFHNWIFKELMSTKNSSLHKLEFEIEKLPMTVTQTFKTPALEKMKVCNISSKIWSNAFDIYVLFREIQF